MGKMHRKSIVALSLLLFFGQTYSENDQRLGYKRLMLQLQAGTCIATYRLAIARKAHDPSESCHKELYKNAKKLMEVAKKNKSVDERRALTKLGDVVLSMAFNLPPKEDELIIAYEARLQNAEYEFKKAFEIAEIELDQ